MRDYDDEVRFKKAIEKADIVTLKAMIEAGFVVNLPLVSVALTPLHWALSESAQDSVLKLLIDGGADLEGQGGLGQTPLHVAVRAGVSTERLQLLIDAGADPLGRTLWGQTALHLMDESRRVALVDELVELGIDVNALDRRSETALHKAAKSGRVDICRALVARGASIDIVPEQCDQGYLTPFQRAVANDEVEVVRYFVTECGARVDQTLADGRPLEEIATKEVCQLLRSARVEGEILGSLAHDSEVAIAGDETPPMPRQKSTGMSL
jgi:ankyrin repeat protein